MLSVARFDEYLRSLGIPIHGISGTGPTCRIDFAPAATDAQKTQANAERDTFDWSEETEAAAHRRVAIAMADNMADPALMLARVQAKITRATLAAVVNKLNTLLAPADRLPAPRTFAQLVSATKAKLSAGDGENSND